MKPGADNRGRSGGFSRVELAIVVGTCVVIGALALPLLGNVNARNDQVVCANNLRLIGQAYRQWTHDHGEQYPWALALEQGGTRGHPLYPNLYFQFASLSNELHSARYLADPADDWVGQRVAMTWGREFGGLSHSAFQDNAVSYLLGLHATATEPNTILAGDHNVRPSVIASCSFSIGSVALLQRPTVAWTGSLHGQTGNILFNDGRVEQLDTAGLKQAVDWNFNWNRHVKLPR